MQVILNCLNKELRATQTNRQKKELFLPEEHNNRFIRIIFQL